MTLVRRRPGRYLAAVAIAVALAAPAGADEPVNSGGGVTSGTFTYVGKALPKLFSLCERRLSFVLGDGVAPGLVSDAFVVDTGTTRFAGPVTMTGGGNSDISCESYSSGGGVLTVALRGHNELTGSTLDCRDDYGDPVLSRSLTGRYVRILSDMQVVLSGRCLVNGIGTGWITFLAEIQAVPTDLAGGEGTTRSVVSLTTAGVFDLVVA